MGFPSIAAVIPVHNRADLLGRLLQSIRQQTVPFTEILIIDNASAEPMPDVSRSPEYRIISLDRNTGFAHAVNVGWEAATAEWIAILNSDVELDSRWLEHLLNFAAESHFATGTILSASDHRIIDGTHDLVSRAACAWRAGNGESRAAVLGSCYSISIAPATACLYRRRVLERLAGFDESYISYLEDVDLGLRCVREGINGVCVPEAIAYHHGSATLGRWNPRTVRLISRNQLLLVARHYDRALFRSCLWAIVIGQCLWGLVALRHGRPLAWLAGKWDALRRFRLEGRPSPRLRNFLAASEGEIRTRARDAYWRWYFRLTGAV